MASYFEEHDTSDRRDLPNMYLELARLFLSSSDVLELNGMNELDAPPASKEAVQSLPTVNITNEHKDKSACCPICLAPFQVNDQVKQLPCNHFFHPRCILPWLSKTNSCPVCRHELPTDSEEYEEAKRLKAHEEERHKRVESLHHTMFS